MNYRDFFFSNAFSKRAVKALGFGGFSPLFLRGELTGLHFAEVPLSEGLFEKRRRRGVAQPQRSQHAQDRKIEDGTGTLSSEALGVMQKSPGTECEKRKGGCHDQRVC